MKRENKIKSTVNDLDSSRFNSYWNSRRDSLSHFVMFLEFNLSTFTFLVSLA